MSRPHVRSAILGAVSLFALGAATGVTVDRHLHAPPGPMLHIEQHERALAHLRDRLHLDAAQLHAIDSVVRGHQEAVDRAWGNLRPQVNSAIDSVHAHIESLLRPEQREAFQEWLAGQRLEHESHIRYP